VPLVDLMVQVMDMDDEQTGDDGCYRDPAIVARFLARALSNQRRLRARTGGDTRKQMWVDGKMHDHVSSLWLWVLLAVHLPFIGSSRTF
jgi:hypothetical protein